MAPPGAELWALCHDAHEAYVGDVSAPLKRLIPDYRAVEDRVQGVVRRTIVGEVPDAVQETVHHIDLNMCLTEQRDLLGEQLKPWGVPGEPYSICIEPWSAGYAKIEWLRTYRELRGLP